MSRRFVLFVPQFPDLEGVIGGIQVRPFELCHTLAQAGHLVEVWETANPEGGPRRLHGDRLRIAPLTTQRRGAAGAALRVLEMRRRLRSAGPGACFYQQTPAGAAVRLGVPIPGMLGPLLLPYAHKQGLLTWAGVHDLSPEQESMLAASDPSRARDLRRVAHVQQWQARRFLPGATLVTAVSPSVRDALQTRYALDPSRMALFPAGVNPELVSGLEAWTPPAPGTPWRVGYLGSHRDVSLRLLRGAVDACAGGARLLVGGIGMQRALGSAPGVEVIDPAKYADFGSVAGQVDVWVLAYDQPYILEHAWELKLPLALASGRPVLRSDGPSLQASGWRALLTPTGTRVEEIAADLRALIRAPAEAAARAARARQQLLEAHTWSAVVARLVERLEGVSPRA